MKCHSSGSLLNYDSLWNCRIFFCGIAIFANFFAVMHCSATPNVPLSFVSSSTHEGILNYFTMVCTA